MAAPLTVGALMRILAGAGARATAARAAAQQAATRAGTRIAASRVGQAGARAGARVTGTRAGGAAVRAGKFVARQARAHPYQTGIGIGWTLSDLSRDIENSGDAGFSDLSEDELDQLYRIYRVQQALGIPLEDLAMMAALSRSGMNPYMSPY